jgi:hypothetical protein
VKESLVFVDYSEGICCEEKIHALTSILKILRNPHFDAVDPIKHSVPYPFSLHLATGII